MTNNAGMQYIEEERDQTPLTRVEQMREFQRWNLRQRIAHENYYRHVQKIDREQERSDRLLAKHIKEGRPVW